MGSGSSKFPEATSDIKSFVSSEIESNDVVIWSKSYCPYCTKTKQVFAKSDFSGLKISIHELDQMSNGGAIQGHLAEKTGQRSVPNVWIKGGFIGGNDDTQHALATGDLHSKLGLKK